MTKSKEKIHIHLKMDNVTAVTYVNKMGEQNYSKLPSDICTNRFAIETFRYGLIRRQMECADRKIHELETQPICYGYRCMPSDWEGMKTCAFPHFASYRDLLQNFLKTVGRSRFGDRNTNMADTTLLSNAFEHDNCRPTQEENVPFSFCWMWL